MKTVEQILSSWGYHDGSVVYIANVKEMLRESAKEVLEWVCENVEPVEEVINDPTVGSFSEYSIPRGHVMEALNHLK